MTVPDPCITVCLWLLLTGNAVTPFVRDRQYFSLKRMYHVSAKKIRRS